MVFLLLLSFWSCLAPSLTITVSACACLSIIAPPIPCPPSADITNTLALTNGFVPGSCALELGRLGYTIHPLVPLLSCRTQGFFVFTFPLLSSQLLFTKLGDKLFPISLQKFTLLLRQLTSTIKVVSGFSVATLLCHSKATCIAVLSPALYATICPDDEMNPPVHGVSAAFTLVLYSILERHLNDGSQIP